MGDEREGKIHHIKLGVPGLRLASTPVMNENLDHVKRQMTAALEASQKELEMAKTPPPERVWCWSFNPATCQSRGWREDDSWGGANYVLASVHDALVAENARLRERNARLEKVAVAAQAWEPSTGACEDFSEFGEACVSVSGQVRRTPTCRVCALDLALAEVPE